MPLACSRLGSILTGSSQRALSSTSYRITVSSHRHLTSARSQTAHTRHPFLSLNRPDLKMTTAQSAAAARTAPGHPGAPGFFPSFSTVNFYAGSEINRFSWKRNDSKFLNAALTSPLTKFIILQTLNPLIYTGQGEHNGKLATLSWKDVESTIRESLALSLGQDASKISNEGDIFGAEANQLPSAGGEEDSKRFEKITEGLGPTSLALVFLGVDEGDIQQTSMPGDVASSNDGSQVPAGTPYFALSVSYTPKQYLPNGVDEFPVQKLERELLRDGSHDFVDTRTLAQAGTWPLHDAAVVAQARSLIDWNERHQVRVSYY
jgi:NAD+ diphosphatase